MIIKKVLADGTGKKIYLVCKFCSKDFNSLYILIY